jgi:hypothetical protein
VSFDMNSLPQAAGSYQGIFFAMDYDAAMEIAKQKAELNADNMFADRDHPLCQAYVQEETNRIYMQMITPPQKSERQILEEINGKLNIIVEYIGGKKA